MKKLLIILLLLFLFVPWAVAQVAPIHPVNDIVTAPAPTPEPTLNPTPLPTYYPLFNYFAAKADPDSYTGKWYTLTGMVVSAYENEVDDEELVEYGDYFVILTVALDGNWDELAIITYVRSREDPCPEYQEMISCYGKFLGLEQRKLTIGGYLKMPDFGTRYIVHL
ncbi:MAG: hypothetical protein IKP10_03520 [Clostridia bacterium]|nr:hypothetical protein [Clostridia bacterium]